MEQTLQDTTVDTVQSTNTDTNLEQTVTTEQEVKADAQTTTDAGTEEKVETKKDIMIPKKRFDEVNENYKSLKQELEDLKKAQEASQKEEPEPVKEEPKHVEVPNPKLEALEKQVEGFNTLMNEMVQTKIQAIPEDMRDLIPDGLSVEQKLSWINKAEEKGLFKKQTNVVVGQPLNHSSEQDKADAMKKMNPLQLFASVYGQKK